MNEIGELMEKLTGVMLSIFGEHNEYQINRKHLMHELNERKVNVEPSMVDEAIAKFLQHGFIALGDAEESWQITPQGIEYLSVMRLRQ